MCRGEEGESSLEHHPHPRGRASGRPERGMQGGSAGRSYRSLGEVGELGKEGPAEEGAAASTVFIIETE